MQALHRDAFCQFPFRWIYYYGSNKRKGTWQNASLCTGSVVKGELHFWNGYLSLLYFLVVGMHLCLLSQFSNLIKFYKMTSRGDIFAQSRHAFILYFRENPLLFAQVSEFLGIRILFALGACYYGSVFIELPLGIDLDGLVGSWTLVDGDLLFR